jgi:ABC-type glycerol-3-phosphate transport system substrate-binding protein
MARRALLLILSAVVLAAASGCEATTPPPSEASQRGLTTIPWNRPAKWEGGGVLGSQMGAMRGY